MTVTLTVPAGLVGTLDEVRRRVRPQVKAFVAGAPWDPVGGVALDAADAGLVVLSGPAPLLAGSPHVQAFLPLSMLLREIVAGRVDRARLDEVVARSTETPWGLLGLLSPPNQMLVYPPERHRPIAGAALRFWDQLDAVGARYTVGLPEGARLWSLPTNLSYVLGRLGVTAATFQKPLPAGGLRAIVPRDLTP